MKMMSRTGKRILAVLVILVVAVAAGLGYLLHKFGDNQSPSGGDGVVLASKPVQLATGIYLLGRTRPGAVYVVDTSEGLVLIDSGLEANAAIVTDQIAALRLDVTRLRAILLTHGHADHSLGAAHLRTRTGAKVYAGRADCPPLRAGEPREAFVSTFYMPDTTPHKTTIDIEVNDNDLIPIGDARFTAIAAPG